MKIKSLIAGFTLATFAVLFGGCISQSKSNDLVAYVTAPNHRHPASLSVAVSSVRPPNFAKTDIVTTTEFTEAIKTSIAQSGVFAKIASAGSSDYDLNVEIVRVDLPYMGFSMTVTMEATWRLLRQGNITPVWEKSISSTYTAKTSEAFVGATRVRLANEGAARANIKEAITALSDLTLP